jgi:transcriptional regulator with XRE-family HTH domain
MPTVLRTNVGRAVIFLRRKASWRQADLGTHAGVSRESVSRIERGRISAVTVGTLTNIASALGASLNVELRWRGEQLDRLMDASHAALQESMVRQYRASGWRSEVEVSFNWYGDRGRVDAVAFHEETGTMLIVEVKVRLGDVQDTLGKLDVKARLGPQLARQISWPQPTRVVPCLVVADGRTARRTAADHAALFARFNLRGRAARRWLEAPTSEPVTGVLLFEPLPDSHGVTTKRVVRRRNAPRGHSA